MARKNAGTERPKYAIPRDRVSLILFLFVAEIMPRTIPAGADHARVKSARPSVVGRKIEIPCATLMRIESEYPKSP